MNILILDMIMDLMHAAVFCYLIVVDLIKNVKNICYRYELICAIDNTKNDIMVLCKVPTDGLDDITLIAEKEYYINFTE